ncbi:MAG TPA: DUF4331 family protein [Polyangia bacterium]|nr:DUF4331 family protein [Polyangia bacterium]
MAKRLTWKILALSALLSGSALAADHADGTPATLNQPDASSDITDVFAWMADANHVNLVMDVFPNAVTGSKFSNTVQYVFHTTSKATLLSATSTPANVICTFDTTQKISCWVTGAGGAVAGYVTGDASATTGLTSADGKIKVFAGLRDDPFFFNLAGFKNVAKVVAGALKTGPGAGNPITSIDPATGCPTVPNSTSMAAINGLKSNAAGTGPGVDFFKKGTAGSLDSPFSGNVLSIVLVVDKSLLSSAASPIVGVWGSTNKGQ